MTTRLFFSYSHNDEDLRDELQIHLSMLVHQELIEPFHDRAIIAGDEIDKTIDAELDKADIILFLVSPDFLASEYCYSIEVQRAMARHEAGEARVIPVILRPCDWHGAPFGKLLASPKDGNPVTKWSNRDDAFLDVTQAIRKAVEQTAPAPEIKQLEALDPVSAVLAPARPRSANLSITKHFTGRDKDAFLHETFEYIANHVENSLTDLQKRNDEIETSFRNIDANHITATIYRNGEKTSFGKVFMGGGMFGGSRSIMYSSSESSGDNSHNESMSVENDEHALFMKAMGMSFMGRSNENEKLTQEGAAEYYWNMLMEPLQRQERY